jgi:diguanylate cyclase (GGDEF)-like protein
VTDHLQTVRAVVAGREEKSTKGDAVLVHIYPTGPGIGSRYKLGELSRVIGRGEGCDLRIDDNSASRRHASIEPTNDGYKVVDLGSMNGTFLNDRSVTEAALQDGDYLRVGKCIYRFLMGGNLEAEYHEEIYRLMIIDALTETHNKRYLLEFLERELARTVRFNRPLSLIMFDIDHFKHINDEWGHLAGDAILRELAGRVKTVVRTEELFARYGGEEFSVVLPEATEEQALILAERIRSEIAGRPFSFDEEKVPVTVSLGVASTTGTGTRSTDALLRAADNALYQAKNEGRNCVRMGQEIEAGLACAPSSHE